MTMLLERSMTTTTDAAATWATAGPWTAGRMRMSTDTAERRRGLRVRQVRPVKLLDVTAGRTVVGQTLDVSATGLRIELPNIGAGGDAGGVRVGEVLGIHVGLSRIGERLANRRQMIPVRVVWVSRSDHGPTRAGVEFATAIGAQRDAA
jgi:hypothetical protein